MRLDVNIQRSILQTHVASPSLSNRQIAKKLSISHKSVGRVLKLYEHCDYSYVQLSSMGDFEFRKLLGSLPKKTKASCRLLPDWSYVDDELKKRDMTLKLLWEEYRFGNSSAAGLLSFSQYYKSFAEWKKKQPTSMRKIHKVGETIEVDFCGRQMTIKDIQTGAERKVKVFVGVLCCSQYIFAYAVNSEKTEDFQKCINEMLRFYGGVPEQIVPDNLKAAVIKNTKDTIIFNQRFQEQAHYHNFAIMPARPKRPKDKGLGEVCVQIVQRGILAGLRNRTFNSLEELNTAIAKGLYEINNQTTKRFPTSRYERYIKFDKPYLKSLPHTPYKIRTQLPSQKVNEFYEIYVDGIAYQVPYQLVGQRVEIYRHEKVLEVYHQNLKMATLVIAKRGEITLINYDFMPPDHRKYHESSRDYLLSWMAQQGDNAALWFEEYISDNSKLAIHLKKFAKFKYWIVNHGLLERLDDACDFATAMNEYTITSLKSLVQSQSYLRHKKPSLKNDDIQHENIRGSSYYKQMMSPSLKEASNA